MATSKPLSYAQLAGVLAADETLGLTKAHAKRVLDALVGQINAHVAGGYTVTVKDLGKFTIRHSKARNGRNPQTGATIKIKAKKKPVFRAAKAFKDLVS